MTHDTDRDAVVAAVRRLVAMDRSGWPGGYPSEIEAALLDTVLSVRARYGQENTGVRKRVSKYRLHVKGDRLDSLARLAAQDPEALRVSGSSP